MESLGRVVLTSVVLLAVTASAHCTQSPRSPDVEWAYYAGDAYGSKYSPLREINRSNVGRLDIAWMVRTGEFQSQARDSASGARPDEGSTHFGPGVLPSCRSCRFEATALMVTGTLYISTPFNRVLALDPATGNTRWTFDPRVDVTRAFAEGLTSRGVSSWRDSEGSMSRSCARRIFFATVDARLYALDAPSGLPCRSFGDSGFVRLDVDVGLNQSHVEPSQYAVTSPPAIIDDLVVVGSAVSKGWRGDIASGVVRAYDARTGELRWSFDPIPRSEDHPSWELWTPDMARSTGGANVWSIISTDVERDLVFLPIGSAAPESYGGGRLGRNDFANSLVALRASTGKLVWSFQTVHHDLWDYDVAAQPVLVNLRRDGREIPAVIVANKAGMIFVLHRETGRPLLPVAERGVPASDVEGEVTWPTQPFPSKAPLLHGSLLTPDSAFGINDADRAFCRARIGGLRNEGTFTPPSLQGSVVWPGYWGGINWDGIAWHPDRQLIVTTVKRLATVVQLHPRAAQSQLGDTQPGLHRMPQYGTPYSMSRGPLVARSGVPCTPPPWGSLVAAAPAAGSTSWQRPLGRVPWLAHLPNSDTWGSILFGGPLVTAGGLVFIAASQDDRFRAFDIDSGALLWEYELPAGGQAAPMTYRYRGRQYVVIAAGGRAGIGSPGDWIVAFALPK